MRGLQQVTNIGAPTAENPDGAIIDQAGLVVGTSVSEMLYQDIIQTVYKYKRLMGLTPNGQPDNENNGFELISLLFQNSLPVWASSTENVDFSAVKYVQYDQSIYYHKTTNNSSTPPENDTTNWALAIGYNGVDFTVGNEERLLSGLTIPSGMITMWYGASNTIPDGYVICDGQNGTPNLSDKFVYAASTTSPPGTIGGVDSHTLALSNTPRHTHSAGQLGLSLPGATGVAGWVDSDTNTLTNKDNRSVGVEKIDFDDVVIDGITAAEGMTNPTPLDNKPPFFALYYIMKE